MYLAARREATALHLALRGDWHAAALADIEAELQALDVGGVQRASIDANQARLDLAGAWLLSLELRDFEAEYLDDGPPIVHVAIDGVFGRRADRKVIVSFTAESRVKADADRMPAVIAAFQRATGEALAQMTGSVASAGAATH